MHACLGHGHRKARRVGENLRPALTNRRPSVEDRPARVHTLGPFDRQPQRVHGLYAAYRQRVIEPIVGLGNRFINPRHHGSSHSQAGIVAHTPSPDRRHGLRRASAIDRPN